jgi:hypothetical protein
LAKSWQCFSLTSKLLKLRISHFQSISITIMTTPIHPLPEDQPLPHRRIIRSWLEPLAERTTAYALMLLVLD